MGYFKSVSRNHYKKVIFIRIIILVLIIIFIMYFYKYFDNKKEYKSVNQVEALITIDEKRSANMSNIKPVIYIYNTHQYEK